MGLLFCSSRQKKDKRINKKIIPEGDKIYNGNETQ